MSETDYAAEIAATEREITRCEGRAGTLPTLLQHALEAGDVKQIQRYETEIADLPVTLRHLRIERERLYLEQLEAGTADREAARHAAWAALVPVKAALDEAQRVYQAKLADALAADTEQKNGQQEIAERRRRRAELVHDATRAATRLQAPVVRSAWQAPPPAA